MKRKIALLAGITTVGAALWAGSGLLAQNPIQPVNAVVPQQPLNTRIGVINVAQILKNYQKFQNFQKEIEEFVKASEKQFEGMRTLLVQQQNELQRVGADTAAREALERKIRDLQREAQDKDAELKKQLGKKQGDQIVILYKEIEEAVQVYARTKHLELVMHYSDNMPGTPEMYSPMNIQRKLQVGAAFPVYQAPGMDITTDILTMLNTRYQRMMGTPPAGTPAPGGVQR